MPLTADELQQLAAPIALYPDSLVAQVLAAATFPDQIAAAEGWYQYHSNLTGSALMAAVDQQPWDPAVKALTQFPSVLANLATNLTWTSSLGEAYHTQSADVMAAIQVLRAKAYAAGNLKSVNATRRRATVAASDRDSTGESRRWFTFPCTTPQWSMAIPTWFQHTLLRPASRRRRSRGVWSWHCGRGHDGRRLLRLGIQQLELRMARQHDRGLSRRRVLRKQRMARRILRLQRLCLRTPTAAAPTPQMATTPPPALTRVAARSQTVTAA